MKCKNCKKEIKNFLPYCSNKCMDEFREKLKKSRKEVEYAEYNLKKRHPILKD